MMLWSTKNTLFLSARTWFCTTGVTARSFFLSISSGKLSLVNRLKQHKSVLQMLLRKGRFQVMPNDQPNFDDQPTNPLNAPIVSLTTNAPSLVLGCSLDKDGPMLQNALNCLLGIFKLHFTYSGKGDTLVKYWTSILVYVVFLWLCTFCKEILKIVSPVLRQLPHSSHSGWILC